MPSVSGSHTPRRIYPPPWATGRFTTVYGACTGATRWGRCHAGFGSAGSSPPGGFQRSGAAKTGAWSPEASDGRRVHSGAIPARLGGSHTTPFTASRPAAQSRPPLDRAQVEDSPRSPTTDWGLCFGHHHDFATQLARPASLPSWQPGRPSPLVEKSQRSRPDLRSGLRSSRLKRPAAARNKVLNRGPLRGYFSTRSATHPRASTSGGIPCLPQATALLVHDAMMTCASVRPKKAGGR